MIDEVQVFNSLLSQGQQTAQMNATYTCDSFSFHHLELRHGSWSGVACSPATLTVLACADSSFPCTNLYTKGVSLTLGSSGITTTWMPGGDTSVNIGYGASSTTKLFYAATGTGTLQVNSSNVTPSIAARCNGSGNSCSWTSTSSGLLVGAPALTGGQPTSLTVRAVESVGASTPQSCVAIQNLTSSGLRLWATSVLPGSSFAGTSTSAGVTVGGAPLVGSSASTTTTRLGTSAPGSDTLSGLAFDGNASTTVWLQHMDVGRFTLQARLVTTMPPLTLNGSASIDAQPLGLGVAVPAAWAAASSAQTACAGGGGSGCDSAAGAAAKVGAAGSGFASTVTAALWTVAGDTDLTDNPVAPSFSGTATLSPNLLAPQGGSAGGLGVGSIALAAGTTGSFTQSLTQSGAFTISASSSWLGSAVSGTSTLIGRVVPRYFKTTLTTAGCGSFTYAGQPMTAVKVQAMDGAGTAAATGNYSGAFARSVTLSDGSGAAGSFSANTLAAAAFSGSAGATGAPVYSFTTKLTAPATLALRASDGEVSSAGFSGAEAAALVRSGRLRLSNAFGKSGSTLAVPLTLEYWGGSTWVANSADNCTSVPSAAVALSNRRDSTGAATATTTSLSTVSLGNGVGTLTLAAPSPAGRTLSLDLAINLGSGSSDQSCATSHPSTTGAGLAWLRSSFGNCAGSTDRDPAARASFGIYSPESRKTVHVREVF